MSINLGTAYGKIEIDASGIQSGVTSAVSTLKTALAGMGDTLRSLGGSLTDFGARMTAFTAPLALGLAAAAKEATEFSTKITNVGAVLGLTKDEMGKLNKELLNLGADSRQGPQAVADAFYDIAGGVGDASVRMDILKQSMAVSEAGAADLTVATNGMIAAMNAYSFGADKASFVADVYTQTVGKGVGTMDEFVTALSPLAGLAASSGVEFDRLGAMMAYMTTKGVNAAQSATGIKAAITALLNPNKEMEASLKKIGVASGSAALQMYGLDGTLSRVGIALGGSQDAMAKALGSVEALTAFTILRNGGGYEDFLMNYKDGLDGVTAAAQAVQASSPAATFERLQATMQTLAIQIGNALLPVLSSVVDFIKPILESIIDWITANPELTATITGIAAALVVLGPILAAAGGALSAIGVVMGVLSGPIGLIIGGIAALALAFNTNFLGIRTNVIEPFVLFIQNAFNGLAGFIHEFLVSLGLVSDETETIVKNGSLIAPEGSSYNAANNNLIVPYGTDINTLQRSTTTSTETAKKGIASILEEIKKMWAGLFGENGTLSGMLNDVFGPGGTIDYFLMQAEGAFNNLFGANGALTLIWNSLFGASGTLTPLLNSLKDTFDLLFGESGTVALIWDKLFGANGFAIRLVNNLLGPGGDLDYIMMMLEGLWNQTFGQNGAITKIWNSLFGEGGSLRPILTAFQTFSGGVIKVIVGTVQRVIDLVNDAILKLNQALGLKAGLDKEPDKTNGVQGYVESLDRTLSLSNLAANGLQPAKPVQTKSTYNPNVANGLVIPNGPGTYASINPTKSSGGGASFRDSGGPGIAGNPYLIGKPAMPELFVPNANGQFIPNFDKFLANAVGAAGGGGMNFADGAIVINASTREGGMAAADGFMARLSELKGRNG